MRFVKHFIVILLIVPVSSMGQNFEWLQWSPIPGQNSDYDNFNAIATDPMGNTFMAVQFSGLMTIGNYSFQSNFVEDICILKYDASGQFLWAKAMGSLYWDQVNGMDCDASGNLYLTGHYFGEFWYEDTSLYGNAGGREMFLMKILADGQVAWAVNGANVWDEEGTDVRAIPGGGVVMSGRANNTAMIGNLQLNNPNLYMQEFIAYFDDNGVGQWIRSCGPSGSASLYYSNANLEIGPDSSIFIGYTGYGEIVLDGDTIRPWYYPEFSANYDLIVQRWSAAGEPLWGWVGGSLGQDIYGDIGVDQQGRLYATLNSPMAAYFNNNDYPVNPGYWSSTIYRWNSDGSEDTTWHHVSSNFTILQSLVCDDQDNLWIGGLLRDTLYMSQTNLITPTSEHKHGLLYMINGQTDQIEQLNLITGSGWRTVAGLEYDIVNGNVLLGGSATGGPAAPVIFGLGEDIVEGFSSPGNWAYLTSYGASACDSPASLIVSDSLLCPGESANVVSAASVFFPTWHNGSNDQSITINAATDVALTGIDSTGCFVSVQAEIMAAEAMEFEGSVTNLECNGSGDGAIDIDILSGQVPIEINWSSGQETEDIGDLSAGTYQFTAQSAQGCTDSQTFTITQPQVINGMIIEADSVLSLNNVTGGTPPYSYLWNEFDNETGTSVSITGPGNYSVTITDSHGCIHVETITATAIDEMNDGYIAIGPNPSRGNFSIRSNESVFGSVDYFTIENTAGHLIKTDRLNSTNHQVELRIPGMYIIKFLDRDSKVLQTQRIVVY